MDKLYYISQGNTSEEQINNIKAVLDAGIQLIQFRMKDTSEAIFQEGAYQVKELCDRYNAICIINDAVTVAKKVKASGVHLGKQDTKPFDARKTLGSDMLIGGTANTFEDCVDLLDQGVNYIGLGPYRFTTTKKHLSPILGINGYKNCIARLKELKRTLPPIYAIGGIKTLDIQPLIESGVYGIALSGIISNKNERTLRKSVETIIKEIGTNIIV